MFFHGDLLDTFTVRSAIKYLMGNAPQPGSYTLSQVGGYPNLRGMMTWSINWDAVNSCSPTYEYADNFADIFSATTDISESLTSSNSFEIFPNPSKDFISIRIHEYAELKNLQVYNRLGQLVISINTSGNQQAIDISNLVHGVYYLKLANRTMRFVKY